MYEAIDSGKTFALKKILCQCAAGKVHLRKRGKLLLDIFSKDTHGRFNLCYSIPLYSIFLLVFYRYLFQMSSFRINRAIRLGQNNLTLWVNSLVSVLTKAFLVPFSFYQTLSFIKYVLHGRVKKFLESISRHTALLLVCSGLYQSG